MNRFINKSIHHSLSSEDPNTVMNIVYDSNEVNSLCITEVPEKNALEFVRQHALLCDIVCCVFDVTNPESFSWVADFIDKMEEGTKILLVGTKTDLLKTVRSNTQYTTLIS